MRYSLIIRAAATAVFLVFAISIIRADDTEPCFKKAARLIPKMDPYTDPTLSQEQLDRIHKAEDAVYFAVLEFVDYASPKIDGKPASGR